MRRMVGVAGIASLLAGSLAMAAAAGAQVRTVDPNQGLDGPQVPPPPGASRVQPPERMEEAPAYDPGYDDQAPGDEPAPQGPSRRPPPPPPPQPGARYDENARVRAEATTSADDTYRREDLIGAGEGVFGKGAAGFGAMIERILRDQGRPNAYIAGREASGAFVVGLRYGSGIMTHKIEGQRPVYWTGPSIGFDVGGDANKVFVLVYNLYDSEDLYHRFPAAEGRLYLVGGFAATYLRRGNIVLIPVRLGVGWRAGVNVGYMNFTHKSRWVPF